MQSAIISFKTRDSTHLIGCTNICASSTVISIKVMSNYSTVMCNFEI